MGRFGNVLLVNGETDLSLDVRLGEVLRFYLVNTANARVFNVALPGARLKLVGGDSGHVEHEEWVDEAVLAPSERVVLDVMFDEPGTLTLEHRTPGRVYPLASITVGPERAEPSLADGYATLRTNSDLAAERVRIQRHLEAPPDKTLSFIAEMSFPEPEGDRPVVYVCPMHPEVVSESPGHCPNCAMKLVATTVATTYVCPMHPEVVSESPGHCPNCAMKLLPKQAVDTAGGASHGEHAGHGEESDGQGDPARAQEGHAHTVPGGIEWEDDMVEVLNRITTPSNFRWMLVDGETQAVNTDIDWQFRVGDQIKIRLVNEMAWEQCRLHHPFPIDAALPASGWSRGTVPRHSVSSGRTPCCCDRRRRGRHPA